MALTLHIFNPSHDEALAAHQPHYSPSRAARHLAHTLAELPLIWAAPHDICLRLPESGGVKGLPTPEWSAIDHIDPWGWDAHIVEILRRLSAPDRLLPSSAQLETWRQLSSRINVSQLLAVDTEGWLSPRAGLATFNSTFCHTLSEVHHVWRKLGQKAMLKSPWSSSGRGVFPVRDTWDNVSEARARKIIAQQGGIEVQSLHEVVGNFAFEYEALSDGTVRYLGLSLFQAAAGGAYMGNIVAHPQVLWQQLLDILSPLLPRYGLSLAEMEQLLRHVQQALSQLLARWLRGRYVGALGVDLLIAHDGVHPCVEINLRRTMGHVAIALGAQQLPTAAPQLFCITPEGWALRPASSALL